MIVLFSDDKVLFDTIQVAVNLVVPVQQENDPERFLKRQKRSFYHPIAIIVDCRTDSTTALAVIDRVLSQFRSVPVIAVVERSDAYMAFEVGDRGVAGWIPAPCHSGIVKERLLQALGRRDTFCEVHETPEHLRTQLVGVSRVVSELRAVVVKAAACTIPILVAGETGSGKELVARGIHSVRNPPGPFIATNMAAVASGLAESELFGSRQGAFTGAKDKDGLFQAAKNGTLFLDEVAEMAPELQSKLLRAVERKEIRAVGASETVPVNTRIISATNRDLTLLQRTGRIRLDLWHRLAGIIIRVPPLRERLEDVPALARALLETEGFGDVQVCHSAVELLCEHHWPGNVRELRSVLVRSAVMSGKKKLRPGDIRIDGTN
ncbi:MAG: sigma 54-interacting transcriptional regulator [Alkalispirochaeta sp.]